MTYTVPEANTLSLYVSNCPTHGVAPVGFFHQLPHRVDLAALTVTVIVQCPGCPHLKEIVYRIEVKK